MIPEKDVYIKPEETPVLFNTWKIIGTDGTKYFFGGSGATETTYSAGGRALSPSPDNKTSTTWYLTRMESANGEHWINFAYAAEQSSYCTKATQVYIRAGSGALGNYEIANDVTITGTDGRRISQITTSSGFTTVDFIATAARTDLTGYNDGSSTNTSAKSLSKIEIRYGPNCKAFTLNNSNYFQYTGLNTYGNAPAYAQEAKRLKLVSVQESTCDNSIILPAYQFSYEETNQIPRRGSFSQDHWGYYNGKPNTALLPPFLDPVNGQQRSGADRTPDATLMKTGILKQIIYPTGGYTNFTYEPHKETPSSTNIIGGLRIATMVDNDGAGNTVTKNYSYPDGKLYTGPVSYVQYPFQNPNVPTSGWEFFDFGVIFSSAPNPAMQNTQGYHFGYSVVEVSSPGNGKSVYRYFNTNPTVPSQYDYPRTPTVAVIGTAELFSEEHFVEGSSIPIRSTVYTYGAPAANTIIYAKKVLAVSPQSTAAGPLPYPMWKDYFIMTNRNQLTQKVETVDGVVTTTTYTYDVAHNAPKTSQFTNSQNVVTKTAFTYPGDTGSGAPASMFSSADANFKNMLTIPVEEKILVNDVLKGKVTNQFTQTGSRLLLTSTKNYPTGTSAFLEDQYQYDANSNLTAIIKSTGVNKSILWGYKNKYPIASVENATYASTPKTKTAPFGTSVATNVPTCTTLAGSLTVLEAQTVTFNTSIQISGAPGAWIKLTMKNASGGVIFGPRLYNAAGSFPESVAVGPGTYTFCYETGNYPTPFTGFSSINFIVNYTEGIRQNLVHTSFEENGIISSSAHSGSKVWSGVYPLIMPHINGAYDLTYWKRPNGSTTWIPVAETITISSPTTADYSIGQAGYEIDDVRLYPQGALMTTYCYTPGVGLTSSADSNQIASFYEYDLLGRLKTIKGDKQNIVKTYQYRLKGQN